MPSIWAIVGGVAVGVALAVSIPPISRRRNARRAAEAGARWVGLANFDAREPGCDPTISAAFRSVGPLYGSSLSRYKKRPVGGLLWIEETRVRWEPRIWLGRGKAASWELPANAIAGVEIHKTAAPAIRSYDARIVTSEGDARLVVVDPDGLERAVSELTRENG